MKRTWVLIGVLMFLLTIGTVYAKGTSEADK